MQFRLNAAMPSAVKERLRAVYEDKAASAYGKVISRYPMAPHVEDARDRLVAMNRSVPEPSQAAISESDAEERSRQAMHFTDKTLGLIKHGPTVVEAVHVGDPRRRTRRAPWPPTSISRTSRSSGMRSISASRLRLPPLATPTPMSLRAAIGPLRRRCR